MNAYDVIDAGRVNDVIAVPFKKLFYRHLAKWSSDGSLNMIDVSEEHPSNRPTLSSYVLAGIVTFASDEQSLNEYLPENEWRFGIFTAVSAVHPANS